MAPRTDTDTDTEVAAVPLSERDHLPGCPMNPERVESYQLLAPARPDQGVPARPMLVTRCAECGGHHVEETSR